MSDLISFDNPVFSKFAFYSGIVLSKTMLMSGLIGHQRGKHKVCYNVQDNDIVYYKTCTGEKCKYVLLLYHISSVIINIIG
jgi:hypothetical protein